MKKILALAFVFLLTSTMAFSKNLSNIKYKNIKNGTKIITDANNLWSKKAKKSDNYFIKKMSGEQDDLLGYYTKAGDFVFTTGCDYEFLKDGKLIGYSNHDLKFYEFVLENGLLSKKELTDQEILSLFKNREIIKVSGFSETTNSLKLKKGIGTRRLIIVNDTNNTFDDYTFTSNNSKIKLYKLTGFIDVKKTGMIQFAHSIDSKDYPWYILLIR